MGKTTVTLPGEPLLSKIYNIDINRGVLYSIFCVPLLSAENSDEDSL